MSSAQESVYLRFRGHSRRLPLVSLAAALRRDVQGAADALEILIQGPPESRADAPSVAPSVGGKGGRDRSFVRSDAARGTQSVETIESGEKLKGGRSIGSEPSARDESDHEVARRIAYALGDTENVGAIERLVATYPRATIELAFDRAKAVPPERIRVTRGALFTSLVRKLAEHAGSHPIP